eukprot:scaffold1466_cov385-Prasinococcus_capsulatus_cf.AAC.12
MICRRNGKNQHFVGPQGWEVREAAVYFGTAHDVILSAYHRRPLTKDIDVAINISVAGHSCVYLNAFLTILRSRNARTVAFCALDPCGA